MRGMLMSNVTLFLFSIPNPVSLGVQLVQHVAFIYLIGDTY